MKISLFQCSLMLGLGSYVIGGIFRRSETYPGELSMAVQVLLISLLLILPAAIGAILGLLSWRRKEVPLWWLIGPIGLNIVVIVTGILILSPG